MKKRLFVGNLGSSVTDSDLKEKFARFGDVENVELHTKKDESGKPFKTFAYLDLNIDQEKLVNCIKTYNNAKWKGSAIVVQVAKESYIQRIQREAKARAAQDASSGPPDAAEPAPPGRPIQIKVEKPSWTEKSAGFKAEKSDWSDNTSAHIRKERQNRSDGESWQVNRASRGPSMEQKTPTGEFANEKAFLFDDDEQQPSSGKPTPHCQADVALLRHAWGYRLGTGLDKAYGGGDDNDDFEVVPSRDPEQEREAKRQAANAKRLASLKQRFAESHTQRRLLQSALTSVDSSDRKRRIVFEDSDEDEEGFTAPAPSVKTPAEERKLTLFDDDDEQEGEEEGSHDIDFRLRPQFEGHKGHKVLELQSRFGTDERFRMSERFLESDDEESDSAKGDRAAVDDDSLDPDKERVRNLDILQDVLGPEATKSRPKAIFKDATQLRFDPAKESAAKFEIKPESKASKKRKKAQAEEESAPAVPHVSGEQFYEVTTDLQDALKNRTSGFSLSQMFAGQLQDDDLQEEPFDSSSESEASDDEQAKYRSRVQEVKGKKAGLQEHFRTDPGTGEDEDVLPSAVAGETGDDEGPMSDVFRRMDDHRFATVVDRPLFFFVPGDRRLLEGAKFFRCQSDPETIRNNFFDNKVGLVKLLLSKRKMAKRALERKLGKKVGSQQWRLGKLRKK
ncbi:probable RNA-binding protein CG14230 [Dermacentor andersoni]|uniref:probable RNA-binding protein CG14230 n=1 Tax=Dermacentor andersoni TaxID=34620 RepID=UPI0021550721|nr:nucleolar protein 8-like [Dermacentor andersoni]